MGMRSGGGAEGGESNGGEIIAPQPVHFCAA